MKRMLITGASGFLGKRIAEYYKEKYEILAFPHKDLDITDEESVSKCFQKYKPDYVVHCAAIADTGRCEREPEFSWKVNVTGTENIVRAAKEIGAVCLCCSSDQVYSGMTGTELIKEEWEVNPTNVYGKEKAYAEKSCLAINEQSVHFRLTWMYDAKETVRKDFIDQLRACRTNEVAFSTSEFRGITDVWEVVKNIEPALVLPGGVYNFGSSNDRSTYDTVVSIFKEAGYDTSFVKEMKDAVPSNLAMSHEKLNKAGITFPSTIEGILKIDGFMEE